MKRFYLLCITMLLSVAISVGCSTSNDASSSEGQPENDDSKPEPQSSNEEVVTLNLFQFKVEIADQLQE